MNRFYRDDPIFPQELMKKCLFYGDARVGSQWGLHTDLPGKVILWDAEWENFELLGPIFWKFGWKRSVSTTS